MFVWIAMTCIVILPYLVTFYSLKLLTIVYQASKIHSPARIYEWDQRSGESIFHHAHLTGQVIFNVSIDINHSEQKFATETVKHLPSNSTLICVVFRYGRYTQSDQKLILHSGLSAMNRVCKVWWSVSM